MKGISITISPSSTYLNPVVRGTAPDPSAVRVGNDFYLATSTFDFWPGIIIRHSTDLVNWRIIGAAVTRPSQYRRNGAPGAMMLYAPTLRHEQGRFYLACTNVADGQGNFIVSTKDPAGSWSDALWLDAESFDPSILYDEGTWYYTRRTLDRLPDGRLGPVVQAELDIKTGELGPMHELTPHWSGFCSNDIEGPHLYHIGDWYYLFSAEGGSWKGHMQTCGRSRSPWGPFDPAPHNPVMTHRHRVGHPIQTVGHAELVDDPDGNWWALSLGTRHLARSGFAAHHNLGRETFLTPVTWEDEWPIIGNHGTLELAMTTETKLPSLPGIGTHDVAGTLWLDGWSTVNLPDPRLNHESGASIMLPCGDGLTGSGIESPVGALFLAQREEDQIFSVVVESLDEGMCAGVAVYSNSSHFYEATLSHFGSGQRITFRRVVDDLETIEIHDLGQSAVEFIITASSPRYVFTCRFNGSEPIEIGAGSARLLSAETAQDFVGVRFALLSQGPTGDSVRFVQPQLDGKKVSSK